MQISGNTFVVTGAARGLGLAIAQSLAAQHANVVLADLQNESLQLALGSLPDNDGQQIACVTDVANEASVMQLFEQVKITFGALSGIVNNAGILRDGLLVKAKDGTVEKFLSLEQWQAVIDVNLTGTFLCGREAAKCMMEFQTPGVIINISSVSRAGHAGQSNYAAAKAGVVALTTTWANELARYNIRSAAIAPGAFETEMIASMPPKAYDRLTQAIPLQRTGELEELADTINFIIGNDYFTGRVLELDGGLRI